MTPKNRHQSPKALNELISEGQEILEGLGRDLMTLDNTPSGVEMDPDCVNNLFRGVHTLKSLSSMFGVDQLTELTHQEENLLDEIRLGRVALDDNVLNLLFESLEVITALLNEVGVKGVLEDTRLIANTEAFIDRITLAAGGAPAASSQSARASRNPMELVGQDVLEVLTEYEEHRLKTNVKKGLPVYRIGMRFDLDSIDVNLEEVRSKLKNVGEIVTYLPSSDESDHEKLGIDIILVLSTDQEALNLALSGMDASVQEVVPAAEPQTTPRRPTTPPHFSPPSEMTPPEPSRDTDEVPAPPTPSRPGEMITPEQQALSLRSINQTVRVDIKKLDSLMNVVGELAVVRTAIAKMSDKVSQIIGHSDLTIELDQMNRGLERRLAALREGILEVRMVPLSQTFERLARMVRRTSRELKKEIHFVISGADTEVDKLITEELSNPLMHLIRNAIDHGVESSERRYHAGKPEYGTIALTAYQKGSHVVIEVEDDGAGIDEKRLVRSAIERGIIDEEQAAALSPRETTNLIFVPGITTSKEATEISGRGVGMDVVKTNVSALGGVIEVQTERDIGTKFTITLPVTLATIPGLLVAIGETTYAIPLNAVREALLISQAEIQPILDNDTILLRDETLVLCHLKEFFGLPREETESEELCVVVVNLGQQRLGLVVDVLYGQQDVVIKPLGQSLKDITCFSGATDVGEERLALVIDPSHVIDTFFSEKEGVEHAAQLLNPA
jgi:two-component system chemotaxis sensor kinase CheA